jgi:uncharacterized protein (DUF342 family)
MLTETTPTPTLQNTVALRRSDNGADIIAEVSPGGSSLKIDQDWLATALEQAGLGGAVITKAGILALQRMLSGGGAGEVTIGECRDAEIGIQISEDKLLAKLMLKTACAGAPATLEGVHEIIEHAKLDTNLIDQDAVQRLLDAAVTAAPGANLQIVIARGKAAVDGQNSPFEPLVQISDRRPNQRADGSLDYRDLGAIPAVKEGDVLMRRHPPTKGIDGITVNGTPIKAKDGKERKFKRYKGSAVADQDPDLLIATLTGQPVIQAEGVSVDPILRVEDVNLRTGHIDYEGTLVVQGSVAPGMRLKVAGDVQILGMVESADIEVGGNLDVKMGISGSSDDHQNHHPMRVRCGGNLSAGHIDNADLKVGGDVTVKSQLSHSHLVCRHQIAVGSGNQSRSGIVGGTVRAEALIRTQTLGAQAGIATDIALLSSDETLAQLGERNQQVAAKQKELGLLLKKMVELKKVKGEGVEEKRAKINLACQIMRKELDDLTAVRDKIQAKVDFTNESCIEVSGQVFPKVSITIGDQTQEVMYPAERVAFCGVAGTIRQRPLEPQQGKKAARRTR